MITNVQNTKQVGEDNSTISANNTANDHDDSITEVPQLPHSKKDTPCPFILGRGLCIKDDRCDFSHHNLKNNVLNVS